MQCTALSLADRSCGLGGQKMDNLNWLPISQAPKDGYPVWCRGFDFGVETNDRHYTWAFWNGTDWCSPSCEGTASVLQYLSDFSPRR